MTIYRRVTSLLRTSSGRIQCTAFAIVPDINTESAKNCNTLDAHWSENPLMENEKAEAMALMVKGNLVVKEVNKQNVTTTK